MGSERMYKATLWDGDDHRYGKLGRFREPTAARDRAALRLADQVAGGVADGDGDVRGVDSGRPRHLGLDVFDHLLRIRLGLGLGLGFGFGLGFGLRFGLGLGLGLGLGVRVKG